MNRAAILDIDEMHNEDMGNEIDLCELIGSDGPSGYHEGNPDPYFDLQDTQEMHYTFRK